MWFLLYLWITCGGIQDGPDGVGIIGDDSSPIVRSKNGAQ